MNASPGIAPLIVVAAGIGVFFLVLFVTVRIAVTIAADSMRERNAASASGRSAFIFLRRNRILLLSLVSAAVMVLSWFLNIGWYRFLLLVPMLTHLAAFLVIHSFVHARGEIPPLVNRLALANIALFNLCYIVLPDAGDTSDSVRMLFGLVTNGTAVDAAWYASLVLFPASILMIISMPLALKFSGKRKDAAAPQP